jgi:glycosyltransferase involved in cell wall biosynthesis
MANHPWVFVRKRDGKILSPGVWGFDDARNMSVERATSDWVLWIDADEWLSGSFRKFLRRNAFDAYAIHQHHFTCDPRGAPTQMDKPARLYRTNRGFKFYGKVHEHAEKGFNGGPGFCFILPDVDIGHSGYVNENVRKDRFMRNFPFLEWDREVNPDRNIGKFLWLRDIIHRMRYLASTGQPQQARLLALDGVAFYKEHWSTWDKVGMGGEQAIQYYSEALAFMGRGLPVQLQLKVGEAPTMIQGIFDNEDEVLNVIRTHLKGQYDRKRSGYWQ